MRSLKILIPLLIALGIVLYIYVETSSPTAVYPESNVSVAPTGTALLSPLPLDHGAASGAFSASSPIASPTWPAAVSATQAITNVAGDLMITQTETLEQTPVWRYEVVERYPHDPAAFTQGLVWLDNIFYEGTGLYGRSSLRQVERETGAVIKQVNLPEQYFGEGITILGDQLYQLTWKSHVGFIYDKNSFEKLSEFNYPTEGWGITHDGERLIMSDGSATLYMWDPETLAEVGQIQVTDQGQPVVRLNELEYIDGQIYANVWQTDYIAIIDPATGNVNGWLDLSGILTPAERTGGEDVLNGIAYNAANETLYVTGKLWPILFEIRPVAPQ